MGTQHDAADISSLDSELVELSRGLAALRLRAGEALEALGRANGHHELGFSSFEAYVRVRCERGARWAADSRVVARGLAKLPRIRAALRVGAINWSMAELLVRHVEPESELEWLEKAQRSTVRQMREAFRRDRDTEEVSPATDEFPSILTATVSRDEAWLFECARMVADRVAGARSMDDLLGALMGEGLSTLLEWAPVRQRGEFEELVALDCAAPDHHGEAAGEIERLAEECGCFPPRSSPRQSWTQLDPEPCLPTSPEALDAEIVRVCKRLAERDLVLGDLAERARRADVWVKLGFASEAHYARERLGLSFSSLKGKRSLAVRAHGLPGLRDALAKGAIGYEAAQLVSRVATPVTLLDWLERARLRTLKHLREEVDATELFVRFGSDVDQPPPSDEAMEAVFAVAGQIKSGEVFEAELVSQTSSQMSGAATVPGARTLAPVTYRWRVSRETADYWRAFQRVFTRVKNGILSRDIGYFRFLCENFCRVWLPVMRQSRLTVAGEERAYGDVYKRDTYRCTSPVCSRRDLTPHHLRFRSAGGSDLDENLTTLCVWCHLRGIHGGRLSAEPPASRIRWRIGRHGLILVEGRTRIAA